MNRQEKPNSPLQVAEEVEHGRLDGDVERRHRLVGDQETRRHAQRTGEADPLALAPGELVRVAVPELLAQPDRVEQLRHARFQLRAAGDAVEPDRLADDLATGHARVERGVRILEDDVHATAEGPQLAPREVRDVLAVEPDRPVRRLEQPVDAVADGRLAAARLADEAEHLARRKREGDAVDGVDDAAAAGHSPSQREVLDQPIDLEHRCVHRSPGWKQATTWSGRTSRNTGTSDHDCSSARGQRSAKAQRPSGSESEGTRPGISRSRPFWACPGARNRPEQPDRVRVLRVREQLLDGRLLDLAARVHDDDAVGDVRDDAEVVRDQDDRGPETLAQLTQEVEDAGLDRHVQRRGRLVGDQDLRVAGERHRDHHALPHARRRAGAGTRPRAGPGPGCARGRAARSSAREPARARGRGARAGPRRSGSRSAAPG